MPRTILHTLLVTTALTGLAGTAAAESFNRVATWPVFMSLPEGTDPASETAAEIMTYAQGGNLLVFTDSPMGHLGFIDITDPMAPKAAGRVDLGGEPTSAAAAGDHILVGVNTSESYTNPSGHVAVVTVEGQEIVATCAIEGQPDSLATSKDGMYLAVAVENERDEDLNDGVIPQMPAGNLAIFQLDRAGMPTNCDSVTTVDVTGLAEIAPSDPEPEYVSINGDNLVAMSLQENNHMVVVDLASAEVVSQFSAGTVDLEAVDAERNKIVAVTGSLEGLRREPDAIAWVGNDRIATANEGDYEGGSRGFSIFDTDGNVVFDSGSAIEHLGMSIGHYPEKRAGKKGTEPEGVAVGTYGETTYIFVGSERANFVAVYADNAEGEPEFLQVLPTGVGPEGILPIPERNLLAVANEADSAEDSVRSTVTLYQLSDAEPAYPTIQSDVVGDAPIGWGALSGLSADPSDATRLYAVNDSFYADSKILTLDVSSVPARITAETKLMKDGAQASYDPEGVAVAPDGGFWVASEGNAKDRRNLLIKVAADGTVEKEVTLPEAVEAKQVRFGFEGVAVGSDGMVYVVVQREWKDDPKGQVRVGKYDPSADSWTFAWYPLDAVESPAKGWVGLSDITSIGEGRFLILERDNRGGQEARVKRIYQVDLGSVDFAEAGSELPMIEKTPYMDVLPVLQAPNGWVLDKAEGLTVAADGTVYMVTDNDGVDDASGETQFVNLGKLGE